MFGVCAEHSIHLHPVTGRGLHVAALGVWCGVWGVCVCVCVCVWGCVCGGGGWMSGEALSLVFTTVHGQLRIGFNNFSN